VLEIYSAGVECTADGVPYAKLFKNSDFGYHALTVERPLRDSNGDIVLGEKGKQKGQPLADSALRDTESVPFSENIQAFFKSKVLPHAPDAWIDEAKTKVGYEIPFNRYFYVFHAPRDLTLIDTELKNVAKALVSKIEAL
jgi:type I restriction enzyme M protein